MPAEMVRFNKSEPIRLYNGALIVPCWRPTGVIDFTDHRACLKLLHAPCTSVEHAAGGVTSFHWSPGEVGFLPKARARALEFPGGRAALTFISLPDSLLAQVGSVSEWRQFRNRIDPLAADLVQTATRLQDDDDPLLVDSIMAAMIYRVAQWHDVGGKRRVSRNAPRISRAMEYLHDNIASPLTLQELAGVACMSPFHFARQFRHITGRPPHVYLTQKRIERARTMLRATSMSVASIAYTCGFSSQSHFSRLFRAHAGTTPTAYRASVQAMAPRRR